MTVVESSTHFWPRRAGDFISQGRLWDRHMAMARLGATVKGGVDRQALTATDIEARLLLLDWARAAGLRPSIDAIGNMFFRRDGRSPDAAPVMTGSHIDTEPTGGRFDGIFGVLAGLEALLAIEAAGIITQRPIELTVWTNEEGCRFEPGCMGSAAYCQPDRLPEFLSVCDAAGLSVGDELKVLQQRLPALESHPLALVPSTFVEAHIEQGPVLEANATTIGVVTGIQGLRRYAVTINGEAAHGGTTPRAVRKDALLAAVDIIHALRRLAEDPEDLIRFTVGRFAISPNSPSVVPSQVTFTVDFRHGDGDLLVRLGENLAATCRRLAGGCTVSIAEVSIVPPTRFPDSMQQVIRRAAERHRLAHMALPSGAGHDARNLARLAPTGMIFIPCLKGISHNEAESVEPGDLAAGTRVLAEVLVELADS